MPSTFTPTLLLEKIADGEQDNTWGATERGNQDTLDKSIAGYIAISVAGGSDVTPSASDALNPILELTDAITADIDLILPTLENNWHILNSATGNFSITAKTAAGTGVVLEQNALTSVFCDGTNIVGGSKAGDREQLGLSGFHASNFFINGNMRIWQRGTSFTATGYTADRWRMALGTGAAVTVSRMGFTLGQSDVPFDPDFYLRFDRTTTGSASSFLSQRVENVRTLANQWVTVSFYAKAGSATSDMVGFLTQSFGTGGSPSADVSTSLGNAFSLTTSWQKFTRTIRSPSVSGKTLGTGNDDYLALVIELQTGAGLATVDLSQFQLEVGKNASPIQQRPKAEEKVLCERYYQKTFRETLAPAQAAGLTDALATRGSSSEGGGFSFHWRFPNEMRGVPTLTTYNPSAANSNARNTTDSTDTAVTVTNSGRAATTIKSTSPDVGDADDEMFIHADADAEL